MRRHTRRGHVVARAAITLMLAGTAIPFGVARGVESRPASGRSSSTPTHRVVSYLVSVGGDSTLDVPEEGQESRVTPHHWQWRIFDPAQGKDSLFADLPSFPLLTRWDPGYTHADFILGDHIARAPWILGRAWLELAKLPVDSGYCDFWSDPAGHFHLVSQREGATTPVARRWDQVPSGGWRAAVVDSPGGGHYGECYTSPHLQEGAPRLPATEIHALLDSMRIEHHPDSAFGDGDPERGEGRSWVRSKTDPSIGIVMRTGFGDSFHAMEPFTWVDRSRGLQREIYAKGQSQEGDFGQLAFEEHAGFLLIVEEYSGSYPAVVNMRSGETVFRVDRPSARAVWVPAPEGWPR